MHKLNAKVRLKCEPSNNKDIKKHYFLKVHRQSITLANKLPTQSQVSVA